MKIYKYRDICLVTLTLSISSIYCNGINHKTPVDYVNPYIGNISHLLVPTYPTVHLPNSMLRVCPKRADFTSDLLDGLPVALIGHRGLSAFRIGPVNEIECENNYIKKYSYDNESVTPYRYSVDLDEEDIHVDFAPSHQSAVYNLTFKNGKGNLVITTGNGQLEIIENGIQGYQLIDKDSTKVYLYIETEQKQIKAGVFSGKEIDYNKRIINGENSSLVLSFVDAKINLRYGISFISIEQAKKNLKREIGTFSVDQIANLGRTKWNLTLSKIKVESAVENDKTVFYTALYRTYERMVSISEDGKYYSGFDRKVHNDNGIPFFTDDWIWDTYRAVHPLRVIIEPEIEQCIINSYIVMGKQSAEGWLPTFPGISGDAHLMNGNHGIATIWDAYAKGLRNFDLNAAFDAGKKTLTQKSLIPWRRIPNTELDSFYTKNGFYPSLNPNEKEYIKEVDSFEKRQTVAITLAACYDDWCLSKMAKELGNKNDSKYFSERSFNYQHIFNAKTGFFHPKNINGNFIEPFDYRFSGGFGCRDYYDENTGWIYRWDVPHNVANLISLMGGDEKFVQNLDQTFVEPLGRNKPEFYTQNADHTGNVGQFSMGNEPSLHIPYLYTYAKQPWKTQKRIRTLLKQWFRNDLMGVPGDEDGGGLSAFVVFSSLGFYPVTPGLPMYVIGSPVFEKSSVQLGNGKVFVVQCRNYAPENKYIQSVKLNGKVWDKSWFGHDELMQGGKLELIMGKYPNRKWASTSEAVPPSFELNN